MAVTFILVPLASEQLGGMVSAEAEAVAPAPAVSSRQTGKITVFTSYVRSEIKEDSCLSR